MPRSSSDLNPCPPLAPFLQTRDLSSTLHYRRLISYDDRLVAHTMPMLIKSMTCIFPPFPLLFVFLPYTSFFFFFPVSFILLCVCLPISVYILSRF